MSYNTSRESILLKEYGRNVLEMVRNLKKVSDKESRTKQAHGIVELMKQLNPSIRDTAEIYHKLWDDIFIIAGLELDVDSPFPIPTAITLNIKPEKVAYGYSNLKYKHYGKNVDLLIQEAVNMPEGEAKEDAKIFIGRLMRNYYTQYNKEVVNDEIIAQQLKDISRNKLIIDSEKIKEGILQGLGLSSVGVSQKRSAATPTFQRAGGRTNFGPTNNRRNNSNSYPSNGRSNPRAPRNSK